MKEAIASGVPGLEQTSWARITLGGLYEAMGDLNEAEMHYRLVLAERSDYAFALGALGRIERKRKNYPKSIELLKQASELMPEFSFLQELAHVYQITGKNSRVTSITGKLLEGFEDDQDAGHDVDLEIAKVYFYVLHDVEMAYHHAQKEYRKRPNNIDVCKTMAAIRYKQNNLEEAIKLIDMASRTNKQDAEMLGLKGLINYKLGKTAYGVELMDKAREINPFLNGDLLVEMSAVKK
jgi:tetratricopeptide (TPR) repeat protein